MNMNGSLQNLKFLIRFTIIIAKWLHMKSKKIIQFTAISITFLQSHWTHTILLFLACWFSSPTPVMFLKVLPKATFDRDYKVVPDAVHRGVLFGSSREGFFFEFWAFFNWETWIFSTQDFQFFLKNGQVWEQSGGGEPQGALGKGILGSPGLHHIRWTSAPHRPACGPMSYLLLMYNVSLSRDNDQNI